MPNYLEQPYSSDQDAGAGDFEDICWLRAGAGASTETAISRDSSTTGARRKLTVNAAGNVIYTLSDGTNTVTITSTSTIRDSIFRRISGKKRGAVGELWINGVREATASVSAVTTLSNSLATFRLGLNQQGTEAGANLSLAMVRSGAYASSPAQERKAFADELPLFQPGVKCLLGGTSNAVADMDFDTTRNELIVGTADGVSEFSGLVRTSYIDTVSSGVLTNDNMRAVASQAGYRLLAGAAQVVAQRDAVNGIDEMTRMRPPSVERFVMRAVTTDATPTNLAPRILVGERELVRVRATVTARQNGAAGTERASYDIVTQAYRDAGGNVTLDIAAANQGVAGWGTAGPAAITRATETTSTMDAVWVVDTASQTLTIQVTGKSATRLEWVASNIAIERITNETLYAPVAA